MNNGGRRIDDLHLEIERHASQLLEPGSGDSTTYIVSMIARAAGYTERQVWRCVKCLRDGEPLPSIDRFELTPLHVETIAVARGNVEGARKHLVHLGEEVPSESTFRRAAKEQLGAKQLAVFKNGARGMRETTVYLTANEYGRGTRWQMDHTHLPLRVLDTESGEIADEVWLTTVLDTGTRFLLGWTLTVGRPDTASVQQAMLMGFYGSWFGGGERIGGVPEVITWDRGPEFLTELIDETCRVFGALGIALPPYNPSKKGRVERFYRSLKEELIDFLPAHTRGPFTLAGQCYNDGEVIRLPALHAELEEYIDRYNHERPHGGLEGRTPCQAWLDDSTPLIVPSRFAVYDAMIEVAKTYKVHGKGVHFCNRVYKPMTPKSLRNSSVRVRYIPNALETIELFDPDTGRHLGMAVDEKVMGQRDREQLLELRRKEDRQVNTLRRRTAQRKRERYEASGHLVTKPDETQRKTLTAAGKEALEQLIGAAEDPNRIAMSLPASTNREPEQMDLL